MWALDSEARSLGSRTVKLNQTGKKQLQGLKWLLQSYCECKFVFCLSWAFFICIGKGLGKNHHAHSSLSVFMLWPVHFTRINFPVLALDQSVAYGSVSSQRGALILNHIVQAWFSPRFPKNSFDYLEINVKTWQLQGCSWHTENSSAVCTGVVVQPSLKQRVHRRSDTRCCSPQGMLCPGETLINHCCCDWIHFGRPVSLPVVCILKPGGSNAACLILLLVMHLLFLKDKCVFLSGLISINCHSPYPLEYWRVMLETGNEKKVAFKGRQHTRIKEARALEKCCCSLKSGCSRCLTGCWNEIEVF